MLKNILPTLCQELNVEIPPLNEQNYHALQLGSLKIDMKDLSPGYYWTSDLRPIPKEKREDFLMLIMKANFLGQGTGGASIGLKEDESCLTLSLSLPYEMNYKEFKDRLEEFTNYVDYWKSWQVI